MRFSLFLRFLLLFYFLSSYAELELQNQNTAYSHTQIAEMALCFRIQGLYSSYGHTFPSTTEKKNPRNFNGRILGFCFSSSKLHEATLFPNFSGTCYPVIRANWLLPIFVNCFFVCKVSVGLARDQFVSLLGRFKKTRESGLLKFG